MTRNAHVWAALALAACGGDMCGESAPVVAELVSHQGTVESAPGSGAWARAADGHKFHCDDGLRTQSGATARVSLTRGGRFLLEPDTTIRFTCAGSRRGFLVEVGEAEIEASPEGGDLLLDIGNITMSADGRYVVRARDGQLRLEVVVGSAIVEREAGDQEMKAGETLTLEIGSAEIEKIAIDAGPEPVDASVVDVPDDATVIARVRGKGNKIKPPGAKRWQKLKPGEHVVEPGTGLRLARRGTVDVERGPERVKVTGPATVVSGGPGEELLTAQRGTVLLQATEAPVRVRVPGGEIAARPSRGAGSRTRVVIEKRKSRIRALGGNTDVTGKTGQEESIQLGERVTLTHAGRIEVYDRAPSHIALVVDAGESPVIHDPRPPTAVGIRFGEACTDGDGVVEISKNSKFRGAVKQSKGSGRANVAVPAGTRYYRVRCIVDGTPDRKASAGGRLRVLRDSGTRKLPRRAPKNTVDADGRRYTVIYQNRLPEITFRWPRAPEPGPYTLHLRKTRGESQTVSSPAPTLRMRAGKLGEGVYEYFFERSGERSRSSQLRIEFDNAAPSAYMRLPKVNQVWRGESLQVDGATLPGWSVKVNDNPVSPDRQGRFSARVSLPVVTGSIWVRLAHPKRGVHYYLRHNRGKKR